MLAKSFGFLSAAVFAFFGLVANTNHKSVRLGNKYQAQRPDLALGYLYEDVRQIRL